jgi:hypothetical protein
VEWLGQLQTLFPRETVECIEAQALSRYGLTELLTDPAVLQRRQPKLALGRVSTSATGSTTRSRCCCEPGWAAAPTSPGRCAPKCRAACDTSKLTVPLDRLLGARFIGIEMDF